MKKSYLLLLVLGLMIFGGIFYFYNITQNKVLDYSDILSNAFMKPLYHKEYIYGYTDHTSQGNFTTIISHNKDYDIVLKKNGLYDQYVYFYKNGSNYVCINYTKFVCGYSPLLDKVVSVYKQLIPHKTAEKRVKELNLLKNTSALIFLPKQGCWIKYKVDYNNLTLSQIKSLGMNSNDPKLIYYSNFTYGYCLDNDSNILATSLNYSYLGKPMTTYSNVSEIWNKSFALDINLTNSSLVEDEIMKAKQDYSKLLLCYSKNSSDKCVRDYAIETKNYRICLFAGSMRDKCILMLTAYYKEPYICEYIQNQTHKDECYYEIAKQTNTSEYCNYIQNNQLRESCY